MKLVRILMAVAIASSASRGLAQQQPGWPPEPDAPNPCITAPKMVVVGATVTFTIPPCASFIKYKLWGS